MERLSLSHAAFAEGLVRQMKDDSAGMLAFWDQAHAADPDREELALEVARRRLSLKEAQLAVPVLERAAARPGASAEVFSLLGLARLQLDQGDLAVAAYRRAAAKQPENPGNYVILGRVLTDQGRDEEALAVLDQGMARPSLDAGIIVQFLEALQSLRRRAPARVEATEARFTAWLDQAAALDTLDPTVLLRLAELNKSAGRSAESERLFKASKARAPRNPFASARLAELYLREGKLGEAREQLESLQRDEPTNPVPLYYLGLLAMERREFARAEELFSRSLAMDPEQESARQDLAAAQLSLKQPERALATLAEARSKFPPSFRTEYLSALAASRRKDHPLAVDYFLTAERIATTNKPSLIDARFHFQVGLACSEIADRRAEAEARWQKALALEPSLDEVQNALGYLWAEDGKNLPEARRMIESALKAEPKNPAYLDSLGWVLFKLGDNTGALKALSEAVELMASEPDATLLDHKADVLAALRRWAEARDLWEQSLKLTANPAVQKKLDDAQGK